ncbi:hypothetical protein [Pseudopontixanthobacter vadosimaris]|uniref:hypothetical protein n=1 Tax=Pseudopontixanthobacter vadosimaris TaxID=2726450 RepID=UPI0014758570|nr:hypothetical protein [Pseudopontixanthobacter vadosimaris]
MIFPLDRYHFRLVLQQPNGWFMWVFRHFAAEQCLMRKVIGALSCQRHPGYPDGDDDYA